VKADKTCDVTSTSNLATCRRVGGAARAQFCGFSINAQSRYVGGLVGVRYAEAFKARSPLLVADPEAFAASRFE
jgi:hypothetical protein